MQAEASAARPAQIPQPAVTVLVSVGHHPLTGRTRRADHDARAVEMALGITDAQRISLLHAGPDEAAAHEALRGYIGMGVAQLDHIVQEAGLDIGNALAARLGSQRPQLVLCGARAEAGEGSGMLPYLLAGQLGWPVVSGVACIEQVDADTATVLQALPRGQRRRLSVRLPAVLAVDGAAPPARQSAFGPARRGRIVAQQAAGAAKADDALATDWTMAPARKRPKRLKIVKAASARDRFKAAAAKAEGAGGQVLTGLAPQAAAEVLFRFLREEGVLR